MDSLGSLVVGILGTLAAVARCTLAGKSRRRVEGAGILGVEAGGDQRPPVGGVCGLVAAVAAVGHTRWGTGRAPGNKHLGPGNRGCSKCRSLRSQAKSKDPFCPTTLP